MGVSRECQENFTSISQEKQNLSKSKESQGAWGEKLDTTTLLWLWDYGKIFHSALTNNSTHELNYFKLMRSVKWKCNPAITLEAHFFFECMGVA